MKRETSNAGQRGASRLTFDAPRLLALSGVVLVLAGYWRPWIAHGDAGLALTAWDLTEWIKFLPAWRAGMLPGLREAFYLPLIAAGLVLALVALQVQPRAARWALGGLAAFLCLLVLPYYPLILTAYRGGEGQLQFYLSLAGIALVLVSPLVMSRYKRDLQGIAWVALGLIGLVPVLWQLALLRPVVAQLYNEGVGWGIGTLLNSLGFGLIGGAGLWLISPFRPSRL